MKKTVQLGRSTAISLYTAISSANFWIAAIAVFGVLFAEIAEEVLLGYSSDFGAAYHFNISIHFGYFIYVAPLACAFAASGSLVNDMEAGFFRQRLNKSGMHGYCFGLFVGNSTAGGLTLMVGVLLFSIVCVLKFGTSASIAEMAVMDAWNPLLSGTYSHWKYMLMNAFLAFLFGALWSGVGLTISAYSRSRYVSYLAPFILCFCSALMLPSSRQPLEMLVQMRWNTFTFPKLLIYQCLLYCIVMLWFAYAVKRRVIHE